METIKIPAEYFHADAEKAAKRIEEDRTVKNKTTVTQVRRFYNEILALKIKFHHHLRNRRSGGEELSVDQIWNDFYRPYLGMIVAKVNYQRRRGLVGDEFHKVMKDGFTKSTTKAAFEAFVLHFEAIICFLPK